MSMRGREMEFKVIEAAGVWWLMLRATAVTEPPQKLGKEQPESLWAPAGAHNGRPMQAMQTQKQPSVFAAARHTEGRKTLIPNLKPPFSAFCQWFWEDRERPVGRKKRCLLGDRRTLSAKLRAGTEWIEKIRKCCS